MQKFLFTAFKDFWALVCDMNHKEKRPILVKHGFLFPKAKQSVLKKAQIR
jgi:hypothetical protein